MLSQKKYYRLSFIWVVVNFVGIAAGTLVAFFLYTLLTLSYDNATLDTVKLLVSLAVCGAIQGFVVAGLQTMILVLTKCTLVKWLFANVVSMSVGMVLPTALIIWLLPGFELSGAFVQYVMLGWMLSWLLAGALSGAVLGTTSLQKVRWSLLNTGAYLYWGVAAALGMQLLSKALYQSPTVWSSWLNSLGIITAMLAVGTWLHSYVFRGVMRLRDRQRNF